MKIPVYVLTGFLDAGKTTFLNKLLDYKKQKAEQLMVLQFESGEEEVESRHCACHVLYFSKQLLEQDPKQIAEQIAGYLLENSVDEIWVEWNGVAPFTQMQSLLLYPPIYDRCRFIKAIHVLDAQRLESLLGRTGGALPEQIAGCDFAVVRGLRTYQDERRIKRVIRNINPGVSLFKIRELDRIHNELYRKESHPIHAFCVGIALLIVAYFIFGPLLGALQMPANTIVNVFLGIMLQALPFLLMGVLISSAIQVFITKETIERIFPQKLGWGMAAAILAGFCLPVCDCASIPIFRSLVRKGTPLPVAVTFMVATPVINPVVMLSTYYAFNGSLKIVAMRVGFGILAAVLIGLWFAVRHSKGKLFSTNYEGLMCSCGCDDGMEAPTTIIKKAALFIRHSQAEFFNVGKYLMIGAFVASVFQTVISKIMPVQSSTNLAFSLLVMMLMAFLLSLCSSSDAVIARSFASRFPLGALMGFLVFGPMIDIKNVIMLSSGFSKRFIGRLLIVAFTVCFLVVLIFSRLLMGG